MDRENMSYSINPIKKPIDDKNTFYIQNNIIHENYWFQDLGNSVFNLDYALKIFPSKNMTYAEKINTLVRLSIYMGLILGLFYKNYLFLYIPIIVMVLTYILYIFRVDQLEALRENQGPNSMLNNINQKNLDDLTKRNMATSYDNYKGENFKDMLNIKTCSKPNTLNPFMNPLVFDSRLRDSACDSIKEENQLQIEKEYNKYCIKDISDIYNHNSGRRQFYTVASTTYPNNQGGFANWLYKTPPTCKEGNGAQCVANYYTPLNGSLLTPGYGSTI
jgi:hypothetical protein